MGLFFDTVLGSISNQKYIFIICLKCRPCVSYGKNQMFDMFYLVMSCLVLLSCLVLCGKKVCRKVTKTCSKCDKNEARHRQGKTWQKLTKMGPRDLWQALWIPTWRGLPRLKGGTTVDNPLGEEGLGRNMESVKYLCKNL